MNIRIVLSLLCCELSLTTFLAAQSELSEEPVSASVVTEPEVSQSASQPASVIKTDYWIIQYHPEINRDIFNLINYPYYQGGKYFVRSEADDVFEASLFSEGRQTEQKKIDSEMFKSINSLVAELVIQQLELENQAIRDSNEVTPSGISDEVYTEIETFVENSDIKLDLPPDTDELIVARKYIEHCSDLNFRWRQVNESPLFLLEILRAVKVTKNDSGIFQKAPELAVQIKRNIGTIAKINKNFDLTFRITAEAILSGENPKPWVSRLEKQFADLSNRAIALRDLNDKAGEALGLGVIDRSGDSLKYSKINMEQVVKPDKFEVR